MTSGAVSQCPNRFEKHLMHTCTPEQHIQLQALYTCTPEQYFGNKFQKYIKAQCRYKQQWIYDIIYGQSNEELLIDEKNWCFCKNTDKGSDRYLVIFKDTSLKTIRNLTETHLFLLQEVQSRVEQWLKEKYGENKFLFFFHYMPSVFQLHLHVAAEPPIYENPRIHHLTQVVENIVKDSYHYKHAVIQTTYEHKR